MRDVLRAFGVVFYLGFFALVFALGHSLVTTGLLWAAEPLLAALRAVGLALMAAGLTMWIMLRRAEAGRGTLNPLLAFLIVAGAVMAVVAVLMPASALSPSLQLAGVGAALAGLLIGVVQMIFDPAYPQPVAKSWPEGGTAVLTRFARAEGTSHHSYAVPEDDLTVIDGIDEPLAGVLRAAGITTFEKLAEYSPDELLEVLRAGEVTAPVDPQTWPEQARRAAAGESVALEAAGSGVASNRTP